MINVITVKHGNNKVYNHVYVNKMYNMITRHLSLPHKFYCLTEDPQGFDTNINVIPLPVNELKINGWWWKTYMFKPNLFEYDINFYIDLDMIITSNIDHWMTYEPNTFLGLIDVAVVNNPTVNSLGSGVLRWNKNQYTDIYDNMIKNTRNVVSTYHAGGDQAYIWSMYKDKMKFWPHDWYESFKWELEGKGHKPTSNMIVFHGRAKPHNSRHPLILEHWV